MAQPEHVLKNEILAAIGAIPGVVVHNNPVARLQVLNPDGSIRWAWTGLGQGSADLIICAWGRFVGMEIKTETGRVRPEQRQWMERIRTYGRGHACVVRSVDDAVGWLLDFAESLGYDRPSDPRRVRHVPRRQKRTGGATGDPGLR